nr:hypothetical protein C1892_29730 [Pseudomonas sp. MPBD7-1]
MIATVGASLLAMAVSHPEMMLADRPLSRASSAPTGLLQVPVVSITDMDIKKAGGLVAHRPCSWH